MYIALSHYMVMKWKLKFQSHLMGPSVNNPVPDIHDGHLKKLGL
jgi:hypothetical protein